MVSCGSQASAPPAPTVSLIADFRIRTERAVDLFRGGGRGGQPRAGADGNVDIEAVAAGHAAGGIDHHGVERAVALAIRKAHPQRPGLMHARAASAAMSGDDRST